MEIDSSIEVSGEAVGAVIDAFRQYPTIVQKYLLRHKLIASPDSQIDRTAWYRLSEWLAAQNAIAKDIGLNSLYTIGKKIPENASAPPHIKDIDSFFGVCDAFYLMNHRKNGVPMFDPSNGTMLDGIGHYHVKRTPGEQRITVVCDNPYPCELDRGILTAMALKFEPMARVTHDSKALCRKKGEASCTYIVSW